MVHRYTMPTKQVPAPTPGRIVLFQAGVQAWPAIVVSIDPEDPSRARVAVFDPTVGPSALPVLTKRHMPYGENMVGFWWWPPKSDAMIEVEVPA